ncbi:carbamate kinase [Acetitomaculum ruminis DSM 5522]|uniref:Carbamate kinase n=1 Tax=Acetitomaculum ruminis DSM 5522 TaxID=1120918 RepID=A0A1I0YIU0_9FIRM|nr:carbamate kinase [Acetitomaculum ruminis]SFB13365.1 carbamate kinase [Acetitomaculum ruminis DSM 5522]
MERKKIVIALGHDALGTTLPEQQEAAKKTAATIVDLVEEGYAIAITHSNGPQVGMIHTAMSEFYRLYPDYTPTPMAICSAMSQGYIGYDLENAIRSELLGRGIMKNVSTLLTQVVVDTYDDAFFSPIKLIGRNMTEEEALVEEKKGNYVSKQEDGSFRRIVAAPKPVDIVEKDAIKALLDADQIVICCGGGGIPVLKQGHTYKGASAVIEKDAAAAKLAHVIDADVLLILTKADKVYKNFGKDNQTAIDFITTDKTKELIENHEFDKATILPKLEAAIDFIGDNDTKATIITTQSKAKEALKKKDGTWITKKELNI